MKREIDPFSICTSWNFQEKDKVKEPPSSLESQKEDQDSSFDQSEEEIKEFSEVSKEESINLKKKDETRPSLV